MVRTRAISANSKAPSQSERNQRGPSPTGSTTGRLILQHASKSPLALPPTRHQKDGPYNQ